MQKINLNKTVYELTKEFPDLITVLADLGFTEIKSKLVRSTIGKHMPLIKGLTKKKIDLTLFKEKLAVFDLAISEPKDSIKAYLVRLNNGESLDSVKHDFMQEFKEVETADILAAEQALLKEGYLVSELKQLCDVHQALFTEQIKRETKYEELIKIPDHPLAILHAENVLIEKKVLTYQETKDKSVLIELKQISKHYHKKGDLLYPLLAEKYDVTGPGNIMWTKDIEIREDLNKILKTNANEEEIDSLLKRILDMISKEENIFFPTCARLITYEDFLKIKSDLADYDFILGLEKNINSEIDTTNSQITDQNIKIAGGSFSLSELEAILNTMPFELTFVDQNDINKYFNLGSKCFKRPASALGRSVYSCHPPKIVPIVKNIINSFKDGTKDKVEVFMPKDGKNFLVSYYAVRDSLNKYLGTLELVQEIDFIIDKFKTKE